jgi:polysaccharide biosynthesis transport protein
MSVGERRRVDVRGFWRAIIRRLWIVLAAVVATTAPAVALSLRQSPIYRAGADMLIRTVPGESVFGTGQQTIDPDRLVQNEISVLEGDVVYARLKQNLGLRSDPPSVKGRGVADADVITLSVEGGDPQTAAALANAYVAAYIDVKREQAVNAMAAASVELQTKITELQTRIDALDVQIAASSADDDTRTETDRRVLVDQQSLFTQRIVQLQVDAALSAGNAQLVRPANAPSKPIRPTPLRTAILAAVVGLLLGLVTALLVDHLDDSVRSEDDLVPLGSDTPLLATIPNAPVRDNRTLAIVDPFNQAVEAYRNLRTNVQFLGIERKVRVIQVTSSRAAEGKSTTAANLAVVLSQTGSSVVLVDADLRKPNLHTMFSIDASNGLTNNLGGDPMELTLQRINDQLFVIVAGPIPQNPSELLSGRRMDAFSDELARRFDYVIIDSAPVLAVSDAAALSRHVDGVLLVARAKGVSLPQLRRSLETLHQAGAPVLGIVLNRAKVDTTISGEYHYPRPEPAKPESNKPKSNKRGRKASAAR